ncbi:hypothetical protein [Geminisphaera colitermitum]|uniref:hypothetical protein n=1 Tax=Geminisphaera colitermitum TaxID=1148786 RepID=UPI000158CB84|nr:hypothetical protein [Geminisphaera colitermitum]
MRTLLIVSLLMLSGLLALADLPPQPTMLERFARVERLRTPPAAQPAVDARPACTQAEAPPPAVETAPALVDATPPPPSVVPPVLPEAPVNPLFRRSDRISGLMAKAGLARPAITPPHGTPLGIMARQIDSFERRRGPDRAAPDRLNYFRALAAEQK